ncbi:anti-sigma factor, partial [Cereibacter changlensis]
MTEAEISNETLMALADGELEPAEAARVRAAVAAESARLR